MQRTSLFAALLGSLLACTEVEDEVPIGTWEVTVTGVSTDCTSDNSGYQETFEYMLFADTAEIELRIGSGEGDSEGFAIGVRSGCAVNYQSAIWLEERSEGDLRWQITGTATHQQAGGGCDLTDELDWEGSEIVEVVESMDENTPEGCTYLMTTEGVFIQ
jgi:hypothetical protein